MSLRARRARLLCALLLAAAAVPAGAYYPQWTRKSWVLTNTPADYGLAIAAGDVNADGRPDVVTRTPTEVKVFFSAVDGSLTAAPAPVHAASTLSDFVAADADNDGTMDLIVSNKTSNTLTVLRGTGNGAFGTPVVTSLALSPTHLDAADFTGDGKLDVAYYGGGVLGVAAGDGAGNFAQIATLAVGSNVNFLEVGDIDHDGFADLAAAHWDTQTVKLLFGRGDGTFDPTVELPTPGANPTRMVLADLDSDQDLDILFCHFAAKTLTVVLNNGSRTFAAGTVHSMPTFSQYGDPHDLAVGEVDGRAGVDVLVVLASARRLATFSGNGNGTLSAPSYDVVGSNMDLPGDMALRDFTGDGRLDIAMAGARYLGVYINEAGDTRVSVTTPTPTITVGATARFAIQIRRSSDYDVPPDAPAPQGAITLRSGGSEIANGTYYGGTLMIEVPALPIGTHTITAEYSGDDNYRPMTSPEVTLRVVSESTTTTLTTDASGPVPYGTHTLLTATVTSPLEGPLNGRLWLHENGMKGEYSKNGPSASWYQNLLEPGTYEFHAEFDGTTTQPASRSNVLTHVVTKAATRTTIYWATPALYSQQQREMTVEVRSENSGSGYQTGPVKLYDGDVLIRTIPNNQHVNRVSLVLPAGVHHLRAVYQGDSRHTGSSSEFFEYTVLPDSPFLLAATASGTTINVQLFHTHDAAYYPMYRFYRRIGTGPWQSFESAHTSRTENNAQGGVAYIYRVEKYNSSNNQVVATSNTVVAMVGTFTDHPILPGMAMKAVHVTELVAATNVLRAAGGSSPVALGAVPGGAIRAEHVLALRNAINQARAGVGMPVVSWGDAIVPGGAIRATHIMELRNALR